jgi:NADH-quinone oxidoreductase subunit J
MNALLEWIVENRGLLVVPVFGFIALYLLLPRESRVWRPVGIAFGVAALGVMGFLFGSPGTSLYGVLFYIFAGVAIVAAVATVSFANPIYSALSFALVTLSVSGLFVMRGAMFLGATTVIIYAGAIVVTFLFIIMLSRHPGNAPYDRRAREPFLATLAAFLLLGVLLFTLDDWALGGSRPSRGALQSTTAANAHYLPLRSTAGFVPLLPGDDRYPYSHMLDTDTSPLRALGRTFFTDYLITIELAGTLLLVAGVGAVAIAPRRVRARPPAG